VTTPDTRDVLVLVGGADNVATLTHCWARLRFTLRDDAAVDEPALTALPGVVMVIRQGGELHVALRSGVAEAHDAVAALLRT
jgi:PTS system arbutin/cellobiose/salicin-specific IIC component